MTRRVTLRTALTSGLALAALTAPLAGHPRPEAQNPPVAAAQAPVRPPSRADVLAAAREMMEAAGYCALVTNGEDGYPQAREIDAFPPEADLTVWIGTKAATRKVGQIRKDPRVTLYYQVPSGAGYVTIFGRAAIVSDPAEKAKRWKDAWTSFYEDRNRGDDYLLIEVTPSRLEIVSLAHNIMSDPATWRPVSIDFGR